LNREFQRRIIRLEHDTARRHGVRYAVSSWPVQDDEPDALPPAEPDRVLTEEEWQAEHCEGRLYDGRPQ
jgi:hypothetical protein